jgi:hypothetical protein
MLLTILIAPVAACLSGMMPSQPDQMTCAMPGDEGGPMMSASAANAADCCKVFKDIGTSEVEAVRHLHAPAAAWVHPTLTLTAQLGVWSSAAARPADPFRFDGSPPDRSAFSILLI